MTSGTASTARSRSRSPLCRRVSTSWGRERGFPLFPGHPWSLITHFSRTAPEEAPTILSVTPHTTTSVLIRWQVLSWPLCPVGCHRMGHQPHRSSPSLSSPRSPRPRTRSTGSCWVSACGTASWCLTACAASATPAPRGHSSPVSAAGPTGPGDVGLGVTRWWRVQDGASRAPWPLLGTSLEMSGQVAPAHATRSVVTSVPV